MKKLKTKVDRIYFCLENNGYFLDLPLIGTN